MPHGVFLSKDLDLMAVTNYGDNSVIVQPLSEALDTINQRSVASRANSVRRSQSSWHTKERWNAGVTKLIRFMYLQNIPFPKMIIFHAQNTTLVLLLMIKFCSWCWPLYKSHLELSSTQDRTRAFLHGRVRLVHHILLFTQLFNGTAQWNESKSTFMEQPAALRLKRFCLLRPKRLCLSCRRCEGTWKDSPSVKSKKRKMLARHKQCWGIPLTATFWEWFMAA